MYRYLCVIICIYINFLTHAYINTYVHMYIETLTQMPSTALRPVAHIEVCADITVGSHTHRHKHGYLQRCLRLVPE